MFNKKKEEEEIEKKIDDIIKYANRKLENNGGCEIILKMFKGDQNGSMEIKGKPFEVLTLLEIAENKILDRYDMDEESFNILKKGIKTVDR